MLLNKPRRWVDAVIVVVVVEWLEAHADNVMLAQ
jgi:hypothetical protein